MFAENKSHPGIMASHGIQALCVGKPCGWNPPPVFEVRLCVEPVKDGSAWMAGATTRADRKEKTSILK
jgi:hypothetical protein